MAVRLTREEKKAQTRAVLMEAAARVFARKGYHAASVDDVAQEAGFTKGAFYSNFESKDDVFLALVEDRSRSWTMAAARAYSGEGELLERMRQGGEVLTRMLEEQSEWMLLSNEMWSRSVRDDHLRQRIAECYEDCREEIARVVTDLEREFGMEAALPPEEIATAVIALTDGFVLQRLADPQRLPARMLADVIAQFFGGLVLSSKAAGQPG